MQSRNTSNQNRLILIACILLLLITGVLYFMKRMEANRLYAELSGTKAEKKERERDLNTKLTDYLQKMEEMTRQLGDLQAKYSRCEQTKKDTEEELKTAKNAVALCQDQQSDHVIKQGELEDELASLKSECDGANEKAKTQLASLNQLQQAARDSEVELDSCQTQATQCQSTLSRVQTEMVQLRARCDQDQQQLQQLQQQQLSRQQIPQQLPQFQQHLPAQPVLPGGAGANPPLSNPNPPGVISRPKLPPVGQFQGLNGLSNQPQIQSNQNQVKEPSYPEEDEEDEGDPLSDNEEGNPLLTNEGNEEDEGDPLSDKDDQEGDGGDDNREQDEPELFDDAEKPGEASEVDDHNIA